MEFPINLKTRQFSVELGHPLPDSLHAVSVSLPRWKDNIGYEEADPDVINEMKLGYPRFFLNPAIRQLFESAEQRYANDGEFSLVFPSENVAKRCIEFVRRDCGTTGRTDQLDSTQFHATTFPRDAEKSARSYWQHSGEVISSRAAVAMLEGNVPSISTTPAKESVRQRIAELSGARTEDVFLFPSGMAAIFTAWRVLHQLFPDRRSVQFGFPYVDTLKIQERFAALDNGVHFLPRGDENDIIQLAGILKSEKLMGLFCEFPSNPLLTSPNLGQLTSLASDYEFPLVVDDTLGACVNLNALPYSDIVVTSLTKFFSGYGDVMGGSLILNPAKPFYGALRQQLESTFEDLLNDEDADVLDRNSRDVHDRVATINRNAAALCEFLESHLAVERVFFPRHVTREIYDEVRRPAGGYGGLFSLIVRNPSENAAAVFDALQLCKGPNLGTDFTLACPYTILAHYQELDVVEQYGISRHLIRVSVGCEDIDFLKATFDRALQSARN